MSKLRLLISTNSYSRDLLYDLASKNKYIKTIFVSLSNTKDYDSKFCINHNDTIWKKLLKARLLYKFLKKELVHSNELIAVIPNTNNFYCGIIIYLNQFFDFEVSYVVEGSKNYRHREFNIIDKIKLIIKKTLSIIFLFKYKITFKENLDPHKPNSILYCRKKELLITNSFNVVEINRTSNKKILSKNQISAKILILGSHILDKYEKKISNQLYESLLELSIPFSEMNTFYLPHPRSINYGYNELNKAYNGIDLIKVMTGQNALDWVMENRPRIIVSLCGSTLALELKELNYKCQFISWGYEILYKLGCNEAKNLHTVFSKFDLN